MNKSIFTFLFTLFLFFFSSCEEEEQELQLNDFVNQEYEAKKNRLFAATIGFEEFEAYQAQVDSIDGRWIFWAKNNYREVKMFLPSLKEQLYLANDTNGVELTHLVYGRNWESSYYKKKAPNVIVNISQIDTVLKQVFGTFEATIYNSRGEETYVKRGVFNRVKLGSR